MGNLVIILGAGASRGVSYQHEMACPSPLDRDFFDLLKRTKLPGKANGPKERVLNRLHDLPYNDRRSMELAFYSLHLHDYLAEKFEIAEHHPAQIIIEDFATVIQAVLRKAHSTRRCEHHSALISNLTPTDSIITFNYDLVAERALASTITDESLPVEGSLYGFRSLLARKRTLPLLLKLHGSSNWRLEGETEFSVITETWGAFDAAPGYKATGEGTHFPIFLPFWDKRIEQQPWLRLWKTAYRQLKDADRVVVWGYSLPKTDVKARQLFTLASEHVKSIKLCVIDPSDASKDRWRELYQQADYWDYSSFEQFKAHPPDWLRTTISPASLPNSVSNPASM